MTKTAQSVKSEPKVSYLVSPDETSANEDRTIAKARKILAKRILRKSDALESPDLTREFLTTHLADLEHEVFGLIMLDSRHRVIAVREMFRGTIDSASVYPREVVKQVIADNAAAVMLYHNHPSGGTTPSQADITTTRKIKSALALIDVRVLDHFIAGGLECLSFAEEGLV